MEKWSMKEIEIYTFSLFKTICVPTSQRSVDRQFPTNVAQKMSEWFFLESISARTTSTFTSSSTA